jgi:hypothetical protein
MNRPQPLANIFDGASYLVPDKSAWEWIEATFISKDGKLHNPDHEHLEDADIGFLWAATTFTKQTKTVVGQAEQVAFRAGGWQKARQEQQMMEWFGRIPKFLITLAADYCSCCSDAEFCALIEHELYHIEQATDQFGVPKFDDFGLPRLRLRGHDVEEFIGVVRRYGGNDQVKEMAKYSQMKPEVSQVSIAQSCGTCLLKLA